MVINMRFQSIEEGKMENAAPDFAVFLPDYEINLQNQVVRVKSIPDRQFKLQRSETGRRARGKDSVMAKGDQFNIVK